MEIRYPLAGINHGQGRSILVDGHDISFNLFPLRCRKLFQPGIHIT